MFYLPEAHFDNFPVIRGGVVSEGRCSEVASEGLSFTMFNEFVVSNDAKHWRSKQTRLFTFSSKTMLERATRAELEDPDCPSRLVTLIIRLPPHMIAVTSEMFGNLHLSIPPSSIYKGLSPQFRRLFEESHKYKVTRRDVDNSIILALVHAWASS